MGVIIQMTAAEIIQASSASTMILLDKQRRGMGYPDQYGQPAEEAWGNQIEGCIAEMVFAKWSRLYWNAKVGDYKSSDVGPYGVRWAHSSKLSLILQTRDGDDRKHIFITGLMVLERKYTIHGWCYGSEGKQDKYFRNRIRNRLIPALIKYISC